MGKFFGLIVESAEQYIRLQAWLSSTPESGEKTRRALYKDSALLTVEPEPYALWLVNDSLECGVANNLQVISWQEVSAWQEATQNKSIWLAKTLKHLSGCYVNEYMLSNKATRASPLDVDSKEQREAVSKQFKNIFRK